MTGTFTTQITGEFTGILDTIRQVQAISISDRSHTHKDVDQISTSVDDGPHFRTLKIALFRSPPRSLQNSRLIESQSRARNLIEMRSGVAGEGQRRRRSLCRIATRTAERLVPALDHRSRMGVATRSLFLAACIYI